MTSAPRSPAPGRLRYLDLGRGIAVVLMIAAHTSHAFLADRWRHNDPWYALEIGFGFVAPIFLAISGATLYLSLERGSARRSVRRLLWIGALAYWLQIPVLSLRQLVWNQRPQELARLFDSNILHVIALTGLLLVALTSAIGPRRARLAAVTLAAIVVAVTPLVWDLDRAPTIILPLRAFVLPQPTATFPLVPYSAYALAGFASAPLLVLLDRRGRWTLLLAGVVLVLGAHALYPLLHPSSPVENFWHGTIEHTVFRLGGVIVVVAAAMIFERRLPAPVTLLERIGAASLAAYVLHLMLVYGSPMTMGARHWFSGALGDALGPFETSAAIAIVATLSCAAALLWPALRRRTPGVATVLWWGWWLAFAALFLATP